MSQLAPSALRLGIDIGGTRIKGGIVDVATGRLVTRRLVIPTPAPCTPESTAKVVSLLCSRLGWTGSVGVAVPAVVRNGVVETAANIADDWIGVNVRELISDSLLGREVWVLNDADAAGMAEHAFGAARAGVVVVLTFGTGIGSAVMIDGALLPNTEFGRLQIDGQEAERTAAAAVKERESLTYAEWGKRVDKVLNHVQGLMSPDLFVLGGEVSRDHEQWIPNLSVRTPVVPAALLNSAGLIGAALAAMSGQSGSS